MVVSGVDLRVETVTARTKTQIVLGRQRFRAKDGGIVGGSGWRGLSIERIATEEDERRLKMDRLRHAVYDKLNGWPKIKGLADEQIEAIACIIGCMPIEQEDALP